MSDQNEITIRRKKVDSIKEEKIKTQAEFDQVVESLKENHNISPECIEEEVEKIIPEKKAQKEKLSKQRDEILDDVDEILRKAEA